MSTTLYHHLAKPPVPGAPLVFAFHGTGGDEHQFFGLIEQTLPAAGIISPRGDISEHGANRFFRRTGEGVYDMPDLAARTTKMAAFIRAHIAANQGSAIYGLGYSNGANILASVLLSEPHLFDRAVLMHPLVPWTPAANPTLKATAILITAGRSDPICPLPLTQSLDQYFRAQGSATQLYLHNGGHEVRQDELAAIGDFMRK
ncbi:MAG: alpha/beta hydrolase [Paracoccaceae bacterium]